MKHPIRTYLKIVNLMEGLKKWIPACAGMTKKL